MEPEIPSRLERDVRLTSEFGCCTAVPGLSLGCAMAMRIKTENLLHLCLHEKRVCNVGFALYIGLAYLDDPTILAWETGNELYYPSLDWTLRLGKDRRESVIKPHQWFAQ